MRAPSLRILAALAVLVTPAALAAQGEGRTASDSVYLRAQRLVSEGNGPDGRAIVDSMLGATRPSTPEYAEALYWKAALAPTAAEAERTYQRLIVEHPLSPRSGASLMRLAQLALARGDRDGARLRLQTLVNEYRGSPLWPRAQYWLARSYFDSGAIPEGCWSLDAAGSVLGEKDVELKAQLASYAPRCKDVARKEPPSVSAARLSVATPTVATTPLPAVAPVPTPAPVPDTAPRTVKATRVAAKAAPAGAAFTVQVAAFDDAASAERYRAQLAGRGITASVSTNGKWHRVRVGRFATRAEALRRARALEAQGVNGFVAGVGGQ
ncbi:MAG TPA: SPOR domain-containing protein [Gemmatimonadaceae bacterium]|nr:SPOR domain-containing protein [Gemmatimonadaceae bacterium]